MMKLVKIVSTYRLLPIAVLSFLASMLMPAFAQNAPLPPVPFIAGDMNLERTGSKEDMQELSLRGSELTALAPIPGGTYETADFTREFLELEWRGGDPIDVYIIRPKGVTRPPVTIYLYGIPVDEHRFTNDTFCKLVTRGGNAAIGFVPALTGQRYHSVPMSTWFVSELHDSIVKTVHDVQMVVDYAAERKDLDASRVAIFGQGAGATIAGLAATVDPRITSLDLMDPWGDWPNWIAKSKLIPEAERANYEKPEFVGALAPLDPVSFLPRLNGRMLKLDDVLYETTTPADAKAHIEAAMPASARVVRYATRADFEQQALKDGKLLDWIQSSLHASSPSGALAASTAVSAQPAD